MPIPGITSINEHTMISPLAHTVRNEARPDRDMQSVLDAQESLNPKPIDTLTPEEARQQPSPADGVRKLLQDKGKSAAITGVTAEDITYPSDGGTRKARVYRPDHVDGPLPVILYWRGGGWVIADLDTYDATPRSLAKRAQAVVISADYRTGPEHKFPAAHIDAIEAYRFVLANAAAWGGDPDRIALVGESAGGNLAINVAIAARDHGLPAPKHLVLVYPVASTDTSTPSYDDSAEASPLNAAMMTWFIKNATNGDSDLEDTRLNVVAGDLQRLPATTIINAGIDPLRSDGDLLANALQIAGVQVEHRVYDGATHEFFGMAAVVSAADNAQDFAVSRMKEDLAAQ